ncbi:hypothetical protein P4489_18240, partial [Heyndrickxia sporothermodurans]|uniref:hypothetical protein n=1 Tax=Heyndrickxia sporothermodurans TaxID=46224 RepID=UPI002E24545E|nr:hypothetical protein [Heyndrickxia sporothermodurans]
ICRRLFDLEGLGAGARQVRHRGERSDEEAHRPRPAESEHPGAERNVQRKQQKTNHLRKSLKTIYFGYYD